MIKAKELLEKLNKLNFDEQQLNEFASMSNERTDIIGDWEDRWEELLKTGKEGDYISKIAYNKGIKGKHINLIYGNNNHGLIHFINNHMWEKINGELVNFKDLINSIPEIIKKGTPSNTTATSTEGKQYVRTQTVEGIVNGHPCIIAIETHKEKSLALSPFPTPWIISAYYKDAKTMTKEEIEKYREENYYGMDNIDIILHAQ